MFQTNPAAPIPLIHFLTYNVLQRSATPLQPPHLLHFLPSAVLLLHSTTSNNLSLHSTTSNSPLLLFQLPPWSSTSPQQHNRIDFHRKNGEEFTGELHTTTAHPHTTIALLPLFFSHHSNSRTQQSLSELNLSCRRASSFFHPRHFNHHSHIFSNLPQTPIIHFLKQASDTQSCHQPLNLSCTLISFRSVSSHQPLLLPPQRRRTQSLLHQTQLLLTLFDHRQTPSTLPIPPHPTNGHLSPHRHPSTSLHHCPTTAVSSLTRCSNSATHLHLPSATFFRRCSQPIHAITPPPFLSELHWWI